MDKSTYAVIICIMCAAVAITSAFLTADYLTRPQSIGASDYRSQDLPNLQDVTKNNGYYNITLAFNKVIDSEKLNNIVINPQSGKMVNDSIFYLNGTAVSQQDPVSCNLKSGDSLQINLLLPCNEFPSGSTVNLEVIGNSFGCGKAVALP